MRKQTNTKINCKRRRGTRKHRAQEQGITLIALVITIIVLLILAGVTIAMIVGDNGILTRAKETKEESAKADFIEKVQIEMAGGQIDNIIGESTEKSLSDIISEMKESGEVTEINRQENKMTIKAGYEITAEEIVKKVCERKMDATMVNSI